jgi:hypothetical protein
MEEQWRVVADFPRYLVSSLGRVKRKAHKRTNANGRICRMPEQLMRVRQMPNNKYPSYIAHCRGSEKGRRRTQNSARIKACSNCFRSQPRQPANCQSP